ncbi:MAG: cytochrome d ubiquinol oxidase subunit II [Acidobacteria bacterium]|nr:cytochrome d ubiquinol oxidase subunit II [Acidobacteriota bacterium]
METIWFCLVALLLAAYAVLDGFDLGAGIIHIGVARSDAERQSILRAIGPFWDGNEVFLLAAGGTLYAAFPTLYASSFSGFYLPLMIVLWLLILRGIAIELRSHLDNGLWRQLWDVVFCFASGLLAVFLGAALGNVIRGVPLDTNAEFFLPLWTNFGVHGEVGILDWYTIATGLLAFFTLTMQGSLWVAMKATGPVELRARRVASMALGFTASLTVLVTAATWSIQPQVARNLANHPWGYLFPLLAMAGLGGVLRFRTRNGLAAFVASSLFIAAMLASAAFGIYPYVLPSNQTPGLSLTIHNTAAGAYGLSGALWWWIPGMLLTAGYFAFLYRHFRGKVQAEEL